MTRDEIVAYVLEQLKSMDDDSVVASRIADKWEDACDESHLNGTYAGQESSWSLGFMD